MQHRQFTTRQEPGISRLGKRAPTSSRTRSRPIAAALALAFLLLTGTAYADDASSATGSQASTTADSALTQTQPDARPQPHRTAPADVCRTTDVIDARFVARSPMAAFIAGKDCSRSCTGGFRLTPKSNTKVFPDEIYMSFTAKGSCGCSKKWACKDRARTTAQKCLHAAWDNRKKPGIPAACEPTSFSIPNQAGVQAAIKEHLLNVLGKNTKGLSVKVVGWTSGKYKRCQSSFFLGTAQLT